MKMPNGWAVTGYSGTMLLDPETNDLVKLVVRTNELPSASLACRATSEVTYRRTPIHQRMVLVPHETKLYTITTTGNESTSETSYANCREYTSTIKMVFGNEIIASVARLLPAILHLRRRRPSLFPPDFVSAFTLQRLWILKQRRQAIRLRLF